MPGRKTARPSSHTRNRSSARTTSAVPAVAKHAAPAGRASKKSTAGKRVSADREELIDVTAEVQRRYDSEDDDVPTPPSSLDLDRHASAARTGSEQMNERRRKRNAASPEITAGDVDADWIGGYFVGDEAPSGDNPTPGQADVEEVGRAVGEEYQDNEQLKFTDKIAKRDRHRWELDPASSEDYKERIETTRKRKKG